MQNYIDIAEKNGVILYDKGNCQFCGAKTTRGVHECVEIFSLGFQKIDFSKPSNHIFLFISVDSHTLQHPEIHGRWNNHFHLTRLNLILKHNVLWKYNLSPKLSDYLNKYKIKHSDEYLTPPKRLERGDITTTIIQKGAGNEHECQEMIKTWGKQVYDAWKQHHLLIQKIANQFIEENINSIKNQENTFN